MNTPKTTFPYAFYYWQAVTLALLGLLNSFHLTYTHYKNYTDLSFSSFCAISQTVNCDTVAQSPWSILWGLPVAIWGVFAYAAFLLLLIPLRLPQQSRFSGWILPFALALLYSCYSVYLGLLSAFKIHSWCILCFASYTINFLLAFSSWIILRRFSTSPFFPALKSALRFMANVSPVKLGIPVLAMVLIAARLFIPVYWVQESITTNPRVATGVTEEGYPWIGASTPQFVIEEFTDYQCFQCSKMHFYLRQLINQYPERIRLVHRHYPLDHEFNGVLIPDPFHVGSGRMALIAIAAVDHGAFWTVNDALYKAKLSKQETLQLDQFAELMHIGPQELAKEMFTEKTLKHLQHDIVQGLKYGITGTPTFVVNGKVYAKTLPTELLQEMIR
jgi:protein-disulfide isomerase/uncharacterized membrane protein